MRDRRFVELTVGAYLGLLLVSTGALYAADAMGSRPDLGLLLAEFVAVLAFGTLLARFVADIVDTVTSVPVVVATVLPPLAFLLYMVAGTTPGSWNGLVAAVGLLAIVPGIAVPLSGAIARSRRRRAEATELVAVTVGEDDEGSRNWPIVLALGFVGLATVIVGVSMLLGGDSSGSMYGVFGGVSTTFLLLANNDESTELAVSDVGLRIDRSLTPWDDLEGYRVTDEEIEVVRDQWYLPTRSFDRADANEGDALLDGLDQFLPRLDA